MNYPILLKQINKIFLLLTLAFIGLCSSTSHGQATFTWTGAVDNDWATAGNWSKGGATAVGTGSTDLFPGQTAGRKTDLVVINNGGTPDVASNTNAYEMANLTISNASGPESGSFLTINVGATLSISSTTVTSLVLNGGNISNKGTLNVSSSAAGSSGFLTTGITCGTPPVAPLTATEYGYSGNGTLNISISSANFANSAGIAVTSLNTNTTYKILFEGTTTFTLGVNTSTTYAMRAAGGTNASPLIIGGGGFTLGTVATPVTGGLINFGGQSTVTINSGTTLKLNSASTNFTSGIACFSSSTTASTLTNNGTIEIKGASTRSGLFFSTGANAGAIPININNLGILNVDLNCTTVGHAPLATGNGGTGTRGAGTKVTLTNSGNLTLKNNSTTVGTGYAIYGSPAGEAPPMEIANAGTINLEGTTYNYGNKCTITSNTGTINSNSEFRSFTAINNSALGTINFVRTAATATTRQVVFTGLTLASAAALGTTFTDANANTYAVVSQKFTNVGSNLITNVLSAAVTPTSGSLTKTGSGAGDASITFTGFSAPAINGALSPATINLGTINTDTASNLNILSGVTTASSTGIIAPGGSVGRGIADFSTASTLPLTCTFRLQVSGSANAGIDFDQIINSSTGGGFNLSGVTLDVTGIYTPTPGTRIDIIVANATGTISGSFASVIGLATGWEVVYVPGIGGKIQLLFAKTPTWNGTTSTAWLTASNWSTGAAPDADSNVTIGTGTFQPILSSNTTINALTINSGATLAVTAQNFTVSGAINNAGSMTMSNNSNLIQAGRGTNDNVGNVTVIRNSSLLSRLDHTIWSAPITNASFFVKTFSPATLDSRFFNYNEVTNAYTVIATPAATPFANATGYLIRTPNTHIDFPGTASFEGVFTGIPNNGTITKAITYNGAAFGFNMLGNPYPSTLDANAFVVANTANIESTLYFWRKANSAAGTGYATWNQTGSVGTASGAGSEAPNGTIQVGQGFFVKAKSASNVTFTNAMRTGTASTQFFRNQTVQKSRFWLNLTSTTGAFSQTLIGYIENATQGEDDFDGKYFNDSPVALTSNINNNEYAIQGRALPFTATDVVSLNFKTDIAGSYTIAIDHFDGLFANGQNIFLVDNVTGIQTNLTTTSYTFSAIAGIANSRFSIVYQTVLNVGSPEFSDSNVTIYKNDEKLNINAGATTIKVIKIFDIQGRLIAEQNNIHATTASFENLRANQQVLIVQITSTDQIVVSKKFIN